jgi:hypothetical protein
MERIILFVLLGVTTLFSQNFSLTIAPLYTGPNWGTIADTGITCTGGFGISIVRDDGTYENGYQAITTGDSSSFVQKMVIPNGNFTFTITKICVVWTRTAAGTMNRIHDLVVYDTLGAGGAPGNLITLVSNVTSSNIAIFPLHTRHSFIVNIPGLTRRAYYIGIRVNNNPTQQTYFSADENGTNQGSGYWRTTTTYPAVWETLPNATFSNWKNFGVRLEGTISTVNQFVDILYYKFENNINNTTVRNCAFTNAGTFTAPITNVSLAAGGQFDSCLTGTGHISSGITTGWNTNLGTSSWTISMWMTIPSTSSGSAFYLFGDAGSGAFRCFHNGVAGQDNLALRGNGITDVNVTGIGPAPTVVTFVYDSAASQIKAYKNGELSVTVNQTPLNIATGTGFKAGGYSTSAGFVGKIDEFRVYKRALSPAEIAILWNDDLACIILGINQNNPNIPSSYSLEQNYPNPFNPVTNIKFSVPLSGHVKLVVFDILGREAAVLLNEYKYPGVYNVDFDASRLASGVYFYKLEAGDYAQTKKMLLVK